MLHPATAAVTRAGHSNLAVYSPLLVIGSLAFLTVVDLFAAQALLPSLAAKYGVAPAAMGLAVNACTAGMAAAGLAVALLGRRLDPRYGIPVSLAMLSVPTALLALAPDLEAFAALRIVQGLLMATAFTLSLSYLGDRFRDAAAPAAFAAYITGNVASNLVGRVVATAVAGHGGLGAAFLVFALLNLAGAILAAATLSKPVPADAAEPPVTAPLDAVSAVQMHLVDPAMRAAFGIGFAVLFAFIGTFTYINFVLARPPLSIGMMQLGLVYLVFLPSIVTTPFAGRLAFRLGSARALWFSLALAAGGLPLLLVPWLPAVLLGLALVAVGTFAAQAIATGFVGRRAKGSRSSASGLYLAAYYLGGLVGTSAIGQLYDRLGWPEAVLGIAVSLAVAAWLGRWIEASEP